MKIAHGTDIFGKFIYFVFSNVFLILLKVSNIQCIRSIFDLIQILALLWILCENLSTENNAMANGFPGKIYLILI